MRTLRDDLRFALRQWRRAPGVYAVILLVLALGIGASTAMFSVFQAVLIAPLPYRAPRRIVALWETNRSGHNIQVSGPDFADWRRDTTAVFSHLAVYFALPLTARGAGRPELLPIGAASRGFFPALGVNPERGRTFTAGEHRPGGADFAVLSDRLWRSQFAASPAVRGKTIVLGGDAFTIVGVMPPGFAFPSGAEAWIPIEHWGAVATGFGDRSAHNFHVLGRLRPGVSMAAAQAALTTVTAGLARQFPASNSAIGGRVLSLRAQLSGQLRLVLPILLIAVLLLLLIACANVANLLLGRIAARHRELALRAALGAGRIRLLRQLLTESILLALAGGLGGCLLAWWSAGAVATLAAGSLPGFARVAVNGPVLGFAVAVSVLTGVLFGLAPGLNAGTRDVQAALQSGGERAIGSGRRLRSGLIVGEVALSCVLLVGAGLLGRSLAGLLDVPLGFQPRQLWSATLTLPWLGSAYTHPSAALAFYDRVLRRVRRSPGIAAAALNDQAPLPGGQVAGGGFLIAGRPVPARDDAYPYALYHFVSPGYFRAMGVGFLRGRDISASDTARTPWVAVVNAALARQYFPGPHPIAAALGQRIKFLGFTNPAFGVPQWTRIVGVVRNFREVSLARPAAPAAYVSLAQQPSKAMGGAVLVLRSRLGAAAIRREVRAAVNAADPSVAVQIASAQAAIVQSAAAPRFRTWLLGLFAGLALLLAAIGLYAVMAQAVAARRRELGVRMALGAESGDVLALVVRQGMAQAILGAACGLVAAWFATRALSGLLFGLSANDPGTFAGAAAVLLLVALSACWLPARRAARTDPAVVLRQD